jgi:GNAT superfamily N-acetyltransferase
MSLPAPMVEFEVRPAAPSDARRLAFVHVRSWQTAYRGIFPDAYLDGLDAELKVREERWKQRLESPPASDSAFVATVPEQGIIGFSRGGAARPPHFGLDGELSALYLLTEYRGFGAGRILMRAVAAALQQMGFRRMLVWVLTRNTYRPFYERMGGERLGTADVVMGGMRVEETAYGWNDLARFLAR